MKNQTFPRISDRIRSAQFENGLRVFAIRKSESPTVTIQAWVQTGSIFEGEHLGYGLSHFLEHMLFRGTEKFPGGMVSDTVAKLGGYLNAYTSKAQTVYYFNLPAEQISLGIAMLDDMLRAPLFPEDKFLTEKDVILRECAMYEDSADSRLNEKICLETFHIHPVRHPVIGYREHIEKVTRDIMNRYHSERYTPGRTFYVIAGDIDPEQVIDQLSERTSAWKGGSLNEPVFPQEPLPMIPRRHSFRFHDPLTRMACSWQTPQTPHKDLPALEIMTDILGNNASSRLAMSLKTEKEIALDISSFLVSANCFGFGGFAAACRQENLETLTSESFRMIDDLIKNGPQQQEIERSITQQSADFLRLMRTCDGLARAIGNIVLTCGTPDLLDEYLPAMRNVTAQDIMRVGKQYFDPAAATIVTQLPLEGKTVRRKTSAKTDSGNKPAMYKLSGGQKLIYLRDTTLPLTDIYLMLPGGPYFEPKNARGATKLIAASLLAGCREYSEKEISEILDDHAIEFSVSDATASLRIGINCPKDQLPMAGKMFKAVLSAPSFPEKAVNRERTAILEDFKVRLHTPDAVAENLLMHELFAVHPYGETIESTIQTLKKLDPAMLEQYYKGLCFAPEKTIFGFAGDLTLSEAKEIAEEVISACSWHKKTLRMPKPPVYPDSPKKVVHTLAKEQAVVFLGFQGPGAESKDSVALDLLKEASTSMSSALFRSVREEKGLAYYTGCTNMPGIGCGCIAYYAGTSAESAEKVEQLFHEEINRVVNTGLTEEEFENARNKILFRLDNAMQSPDKLLATAVSSEFVGRGYLDAFQKRELLKQLDRKEVNAILKQYLSQPNKVSVIVTPEKQ